ncbi:hypothetical protein J2S09_001317 [Bacillus fengqiuensis]|nr:hypothetical protein [Bacillus fengqiuensis]
MATGTSRKHVDAEEIKNRLLTLTAEKHPAFL